MVDLIRSQLLEAHGFSHGFSLRTGGVSEGVFSSANLGRGLGDVASKVAENHRLLAAAIGYGQLFEVSQVHGKAIRSVLPEEDPKTVRQEEGDALIARAQEVAVGVRTADCVPVLIGNLRDGSVAAVHSGWRGCVQNIVGATIKEMGNPSDLIACVGPHISHLAFEVGEDVAAQIQLAAGPTDLVTSIFQPSDPLIQIQRDRTGHIVKPNQHYANLNRVVTLQLHRAGLRHEHIESLGHTNCTFIQKERYFSYRRDGETGRHLAVIIAK